jgi:hypothetical protein
MWLLALWLEPASVRSLSPSPTGDKERAKKVSEASLGPPTLFKKHCDRIRAAVAAYAGENAIPVLRLKRPEPRPRAGHRDHRQVAPRAHS